MARNQLFRGYRALTVAFSGGLACAAALVQSYFVRVETQLTDFLTFWISIASICLIAAAVQLWRRVRLADSRLARQATLLATEQFLPSLLVGAVITLCIYRYAPASAWMLPGMWSLVYSLGIFASYRLLPRQVVWVALYYVFAGALCLGWGQGANTLAAWQMALCFGGGQLFGAAVLYWTLERQDGTSE